MPGIAHVPTVFEFPDISEKARKWLEWEMALEKIGRAFVSPPAVPPQRVEFLHASLGKSLENDNLIRSARRRHLLVDYLTGKEIEALVHDVLEMDSTTVKSTWKGPLKQDASFGREQAAVGSARFDEPLMHPAQIKG